MDELEHFEYKQWWQRGRDKERKHIFELLEQEQQRTKLGFIQYKRIEEIVNGTSNEDLH